MKKSNLFKIVNGVKVFASFYKELKKDESGNLYEGSNGGYFVEDAQGGTMFLYWDLAVIYAEFISYGLTPREAWEASCAFFDDPDHARVNYVPGLIIDTCLNKGRAAAVIDAREAAVNVSEEKESAEETPAATIKEAENTADDAQAADDLADIAERLEAEARRFEAVRRIAARRRALLIRMTTGGRGKTAEAWKFARVTLSAYGEKVVTVWAVGMTETIYTRTYRVKADGSRYEVRHNYTTENTAAAANWLRSIHRAALLNGWGLTIETATAAEVKEADPAARLSSFIPGADRLADTFERLADLRAAERMTPAEVAAPAADLTADSEADTITPGAAVVPAAVDAIKAAFKKVPALLVRLNVLVLRVLLIALLLAGAFALVPLTGNTVAGLVGSGVLPLLFITVPCVFAVCFVWGYANVKLWDALCIFK